MKNDSAEVSASTLARLLSISEVQLGKLAVQGHIVRKSHGKYDLWQSVRAYVIYLHQRIRDGRSAPAEHTKDLAAAKIREMRERGDRVAMENARMRAELVPVDDLMRAYSKFLVSARERILACSLLAEEKEALMTDLRGLLDREALEHDGARNGHSSAGGNPGDAAGVELPGVGG